MRDLETILQLLKQLDAASPDPEEDNRPDGVYPMKVSELVVRLKAGTSCIISRKGLREVIYYLENPNAKREIDN